jgi:DNA-binding NarL/FixJ family response regulator
MGTDQPLQLNSLASVGNALADRPYARRGVPVSGETIRVILVDDHTIVRAGLKALLRSAPDIALVGEAEGGDDAVALAARVSPHVAVMDLDMPRGDGLSATRAMSAMEHPPRVLILTMHSEEARLLEALEAGASGYLMKDAAERELIDAIRAVAAGEVYVRPRVARLLAARVRGSGAGAGAPAPRDREELAALSERERTVVRMIAEGYNGPEIGRQLGISAKTVDTYKQRVEEKLGLVHRTEYVRFALELDLLHK